VSEARACGALWRERQSCCCVELHVEFTGTVSVAQQSSVGAQAGNPPSETPHWVRPETSSQSQRLEAPISSDVQEQCTILYYIGCCGVARALPKLHRLDSFAPNAQALCASSSGEGSCCTWLAYDGADFLEHARASIFFPSRAGGRLGGRSQKKAAFMRSWNGTMSHRLTAFRNRLSPPVGTLPRFRHSQTARLATGIASRRNRRWYDWIFLFLWALPIPVTMIRPARTLLFKFVLEFDRGSIRGTPHCNAIGGALHAAVPSRMLAVAALAARRAQRW